MALTGITARWLAAAASCCLLLSGARAADGPDPLDRAVAAVDRARRGTQRRNEPATILAALDAAATSLEDIPGPARPELVAVGPEASEKESSRTGEENRRRLMAWRAAYDTHRKRRERLLARWVRVLGEALIIRRIEGEWIHLSRLTAADAMAVHALEDLHKLGSPHIFDWLRRTFVGQERDLIRSVPTNHLMRARALDENPPDLPVLAMQAIARHEHMPGNLRHAMVRDLVAAYAPLERRAAGGFDVARWDRMRIAVLHATLSQAGEPRDEAGELLTTMADLARWFRQHTSPRGEHWTD